MYSVASLAREKLSSVRRIGGRVGAVSSAQRAWKTGRARSGSEPRPARRARDMFSWTGTGRLGVAESLRALRCGFARAMRFRSVER